MKCLLTKGVVSVQANPLKYVEQIFIGNESKTSENAFRRFGKEAGEVIVIVLCQISALRGL